MKFGIFHELSVGHPWRPSARRHSLASVHTPCEVWLAAPVMGQDNDYVYGELPGVSSEQIEDLKARQVIY